MAPQGRKLRIKLSTSFPGQQVVRQTPGRSATWGQAEFFIDQPVEECDAWFVYDGITTRDETLCPPGNLCLLTSEPSTYKRYNTRWLMSFDRVLTSQAVIRHPHAVRCQTGLPWLMNKTYDELRQGALPEKTGHLSVISSAKTTTRGHRQRLAFVRELMRQVPVEVFGRGFRAIDDKWEGLAPFRFSIAIENSRHRDYWTEKFSDCVLAGTIPLYHGCPNVGDYFSPDAWIPLNIHDVSAAIQRVRQVLEDPAGEYHRRLPALHEARRLILDEYNLFNVITRMVEKMDIGLPAEKRVLAPEPAPGWLTRRWLKLSKRWLGWDCGRPPGRDS